MVNQKGGLYTINHLHHPHHSQQPESLHMTATEYLVVYKSNACISAKNVNQTSSSAGTMSTAADFLHCHFCNYRQVYTAAISVTNASDSHDQWYQQVCSKQQA